MPRSASIPRWAIGDKGTPFRRQPARCDPAPALTMETRRNFRERQDHESAPPCPGMGKHGHSTPAPADEPPIIDQIQVQDTCGIALAPHPAELLFCTMEQDQKRSRAKPAVHQGHGINELRLGARRHGRATVEVRAGLKLNPCPAQRAKGGPQHLLWPTRSAP